MRVLPRLLLLCLPLASLGAQSPCATCGGQGLLRCRSCLDVEAGLCTVALACRTCKGALATACADCSPSTAVEAALRRRRERSADFAAENRAWLEEHGVEDRGVRCRSPHFDLLIAVGRIEGGPETDPHRALHLYLTRLEGLRADLVARLGAEVPAGITLALVQDERDHRRLSRGLTGLEVQGLGRLGSGNPPAAVLLAPSSEDGTLHGLLVHSATHLLLGDLDEVGWLDAGLAHWFEAEQTGTCRYYCILATPQTPRSFWGGDLRLGVRGLLESGGLPDLAGVLSADASDLDFAGHALAFALVDFLLAQLPAPITHDAGPQRPPPVRELLDAIRAGTPADTALGKVLGRSVADVEAALLEFVRQKYRLR